MNDLEVLREDGNLNSQENKPETITQLAQRHLHDENHTATDEEIKNAVVEVDEGGASVEDLEKLAEVDNTTVVPPLPIERDDDNKQDEKEEYTPPNPYDVLGS